MLVGLRRSLVRLCLLLPPFSITGQVPRPAEPPRGSPPARWRGQSGRSVGARRVLGSWGCTPTRSSCPVRGRQHPLVADQVVPRGDRQRHCRQPAGDQEGGQRPGTENARRARPATHHIPTAAPVSFAHDRADSRGEGRTCQLPGASRLTGFARFGLHPSLNDPG